MTLKRAKFIALLNERRILYKKFYPYFTQSSTNVLFGLLIAIEPHE